MNPKGGGHGHSRLAAPVALRKKRLWKIEKTPKSKMSIQAQLSLTQKCLRSGSQLELVLESL